MRNFGLMLIAAIVIFLIVIVIYTNSFSGAGKEETASQNTEPLETALETITSAPETTAIKTTTEETIATATTNGAETFETTTEDIEEKIPEGMPTLKLVISEGPVVMDNDLCYYRIEARATGDPYPVISFSKDDSSGVWGKNIAQINLKNGESYNLVVTAVNSVGKVTRNIELSWSQ